MKISIIISLLFFSLSCNLKKSNKGFYYDAVYENERNLQVLSSVRIDSQRYSSGYIYFLNNNGKSLVLVSLEDTTMMYKNIIDEVRMQNNPTLWNGVNYCLTPYSDELPIIFMQLDIEKETYKGALLYRDLQRWELKEERKYKGIKVKVYQFDSELINYCKMNSDVLNRYGLHRRIDSGTKSQTNMVYTLDKNLELKIVILGEFTLL